METDRAVADSNQPHPRRGRRRLTIALVLFVVLGGAAAIGWYVVVGKISMSAPYQAVLALVQKNPQVIQRLGDPVVATWRPPSGSIDSEKANFRFNVVGPKGKASVWAEARKFHDKWGLQVVQVMLPGEERPLSLNMAAGAGSNEDDAPRFAPAPSGNAKQAAPPPNTGAPKPAPAPSGDGGLDLNLDVGAPSITPPAK